MRTQIDVTVTEGDVTQGRVCPVALAIQRVLPGYDVCTYLDMALVKNDYQKFYARLPAEAQAFVRAFDEGRNVGGISFTLDFQAVREHAPDRIRTGGADRSLKHRVVRV